MSRGVKIYIVVTTILLLGVVGMIVLNALFWKGMVREDPRVIQNIRVSARLVRPADIDRAINVPDGENPSRKPKAGLYLLTRAWLRDLPAKSVISIYGEIEEPALLRGQQVHIDGYFLEEAKYHLEPIRPPVSGESFSEEQIRQMVSEPAVIKITKVMVK